MRKNILLVALIVSFFISCSSDNDTSPILLTPPVPQTYKPDVGIAITSHSRVAEDNIRIWKYNRTNFHFELQNNSFHEGVRLAQASVKIGDSIRIATVAIDLSTADVYQVGYKLSYRQATGNQELVYWNSPLINSPQFIGGGMPTYGWAYLDFTVPQNPD